MANNRMFIRCRTCGNYIHIGSILGGFPYVCTTNKEELQDFFLKHYICTEEQNNEDYLEPKFKYEDVDIENNFEIAYEVINKK